MACVYGLCRIGDPAIRYIGWTSQPVRVRFSAHKTAAKSGDKKLVYQWMRQHDDITFTILHDSLTNDKAKELEIIEIAAHENLTNMSKGGQGSPGYKHTPEALIKIGLAAKGQTHSRGRKLTPETRALISAKAKANVDEKERARLANLRKGAKSSPEHRAKQSAAMKGKPSAIKGKKQATVTCPYCNKTGGNTMGRWHFNNCKLKENQN